METIKTASQRATLRNGLRALGLLALLTLGSGIVEQATAGCPQVPAPVKPTANWMSPTTSFGGARLMKVGLTTVSEDSQEQNLITDLFRAPIVGLWAFKYISEGNANKPFPINFTDGYAVDGGNTTWFADGNEITYSGVRDPTSGATSRSTRPPRCLDRHTASPGHRRSGAPVLARIMRILRFDAHHTDVCEPNLLPALRLLLRRERLGRYSHTRTEVRVAIQRPDVDRAK
jgi:hypothetical protein